MSSPGQDKANFSHDIGELVLVKWNDGMVYFAKIRRIDYRKRKCVVVFDDRSTDEADFSQIHSGKPLMCVDSSVRLCLAKYTDLGMCDSNVKRKLIRAVSI